MLHVEVSPTTSSWYISDSDTSSGSFAPRDSPFPYSLQPRLLPLVDLPAGGEPTRSWAHVTFWAKLGLVPGAPTGPGACESPTQGLPPD